MKCTILHEGKGRMRVHVEKVRMTLKSGLDMDESLSLSEKLTDYEPLKMKIQNVRNR